MTTTIVTAIVSAAITALWEHFLGKTEKIDKNSTVDLVSDIAIRAVNKALKK